MKIDAILELLVAYAIVHFGMPGWQAREWAEGQRYKFPRLPDPERSGAT